MFDMRRTLRDTPAWGHHPSPSTSRRRTVETSERRRTMATIATAAKTTARKPVDVLKPKSGRIDIVNIPERLILAIDGVGQPPGGEFGDAIGALYSVSFTAKFDAKARSLGSPKVQMLECLWDMGPQNDAWKWRLFIEQMPPLDVRAVKRAIGLAKAKKPNPLHDRLEVTRWKEGLCAQTLHIGPYDAVGTVYGQLEADVAKLGFRFAGTVHEIYMNDPGRVGPDKTKTLIRVPIAKL